MIQSLPNIPAKEETLVVKACCLLMSLIKVQKIVIPNETLSSIISWLIKSLKANVKSIGCDILKTLKMLFKGKSTVLVKFHESLISPENGILVMILKMVHEKDKKTSYETNSLEDLKLSAIYSLESILTFSDETEFEIEISPKWLEEIGTTVVNLIYAEKPEKYDDLNYIGLITTAFNILKIITEIEKEWAVEKLGELLGASKSFIMYGIPDTHRLPPQKVMVSQQALSEPQSVAIETRGGKIAKTRKPRSICKPKKVIDSKAKSNANVERQPYSGTNINIECK